jgi:hypothetical protein
MSPGPRCTICAHPRRAEIEFALVQRMSRRDIGKKFSVDPQAVWRHGRNHLSEVVRAEIMTQSTRMSADDLEKLRVCESESLLSNLVAQRGRLLQDSDTARGNEDTNAAVRAEMAIQANLALVGKLLGQLVQRHEVSHTNLLVSPDYIRLRQVLVDALRPFPDAGRAVAAALHRLESQAAKDITNAAQPAEPEVIDLPALPKRLPPMPPPPRPVASC